MESPMERIKDLEEMLDKIDQLWSQYRELVLRTFEMWYEIKGTMVSKIAELHGLIEYCKERLREIDIKVKIGLMDEDEANKQRADFEKALKEANDTLGKLENYLNTFEKRIENHLKNIVQLYLTSEEKFKAQLSKLEELYKEGKISESVYRRIRTLLGVLKS